MAAAATKINAIAAPTEVGVMMGRLLPANPTGTTAALVTRPAEAAGAAASPATQGMGVGEIAVVCTAAAAAVFVIDCMPAVGACVRGASVCTGIAGACVVQVSVGDGFGLGFGGGG